MHQIIDTDIISHEDYPKDIWKKIGNLTVIGWGHCKIRKNGDKRKSIKCKCQCGTIKDVSPTTLCRGQGRGCKQCRQPKYLGRKFGKLTIIGFGEEKIYNGTRKVKCQCDCGTICERRHRGVVSIETYSCGCSYKPSPKGNMINGKGVSKIALKLHKMIGGEINYYVDGTKCCNSNARINVDIAFPEEKIAIEYDGWYYHKDSLEKDEKLTKLLIDNGWKVLRIKSRRNLPVIDEINSKLNNLRNGSSLEIIEMSDWAKS